MSHMPIVMNITLLKCLSAAQPPKELFHNPPAIAFVRNFCQLYGLIHNDNAHPSASCAVEAPEEKLNLNELGL